MKAKKRIKLNMRRALSDLVVEQVDGRAYIDSYKLLEELGILLKIIKFIGSDIK